MPVIYTIANAEFLAGVLNALAMVFGSDAWTGANGLGGFAAMMALVTLMISGFMYAFNQKFEMHHIVVMLVVYMALFGIKIDVAVQDVHSVQTEKVDNVPIGVALPGWIISSVVYSVTEGLSTALASTTNEEVNLSTNGFLHPLRTLMAVRNVNPVHVGPYHAQSALQYHKYCYEHRSPENKDPKKLQTEPNPGDIYWGQAEAGGLGTMVYTEENPRGENMDCQEAAEHLQGEFNKFLSAPYKESDDTVGASSLANVIYGNQAKQSHIRGRSGEEVVEASLASLNAANLNAAQWHIQNAYLNNLLNLGPDPDRADKQTVMMLTQAREQAALDAAGGASGWLSTMFFAVLFFQALFFLVSPIVALLMVAYGINGLGYLGKWILFGVWTLSFPIPAVFVNHWAISTISGELTTSGAIKAGYFSIAGFDDFYNHVLSAMTMANKVLALSPIVMGAILYGSYQMLSHMMTRISGQDYFDEAQASPALGQSAAMASAGTPHAMPHNMPQLDGGTGHRASVMEETKGTINIGEEMQTALRHAESEAQREGADFKQAQQRLASTVESATEGYSTREQYESLVRGAIDNNESLRETIKDIDRESNGYSREELINEVTSAGVKGGVGAALSALKNIVSASVEGKDQSMNRLESDHSVQRSTESGEERAAEVAYQFNLGAAEHIASTHSESAEVRDAKEHASREEESYQRAYSRQQSLEQTASRMESVGLQTSVSANGIAARLSNEGVTGVEQIIGRNVNEAAGDYSDQTGINTEDFRSRVAQAGEDAATPTARFQDKLFELADMANEEGGVYAAPALAALTGSLNELGFGSPSGTGPELDRGETRDNVEDGLTDGRAEFRANRDAATAEPRPTDEALAERRAALEARHDDVGSEARDRIGKAEEGAHGGREAVRTESEDTRNSVAYQQITQQAEMDSHRISEIAKSFRGAEGVPADELKEAVFAGDHEEVSQALHELGWEHGEAIGKIHDAITELYPDADPQMAGMAAVGFVDQPQQDWTSWVFSGAAAVTGFQAGKQALDDMAAKGSKFADKAQDVLRSPGAARAGVAMFALTAGNELIDYALGQEEASGMSNLDHLMESVQRIGNDDPMKALAMTNSLKEMSGDDKQDFFNGFTDNMQYGTGTWWDSVTGGDRLNTDKMDEYVEGRLLRR